MADLSNFNTTEPQKKGIILPIIRSQEKGKGIRLKGVGGI